MVLPPRPPASNEAWTSLLHAEVGHLLRQAGIPVLHIKGPTVATWLFAPGEREWGDVDVLVAPSRIDDALAVLTARGFTERFEGIGRKTTTDHAVCMFRADAATGQDEVDVHDRFPGIDGDAEAAFAELWRRREPAQLAHTDVWFPDVVTRALLIALNCARDPTSKAREDVSRLVHVELDWELVVQLAQRIDALSGLRAGLDLDERGRGIVASTALAHVVISPEWRLRLEGAPRTALRLDELRHMSWNQRVRVVPRWLFPPPAVLRMRDPSVGTGALAVTRAYARRLGDGVRALPETARAMRRIR